jgi:acetoin utilization deacetylase AcuC-like enzyme
MMTGGSGVPLVWDEKCLLHVPLHEVWLGEPLIGTEVPERALVLRDALVGAGARLIPAEPHDDGVLRTVHSDALVDHLATIWDGWQAAGYGRERVVPYLFPTAGMLDGLPLREATAAHGRAGRYCYDTMTLVGSGSWAAIRGAVDVAQTAAGLVAEGGRLAYGLCRPPGHHVTRDAYGGSCYLNNAAIAAQALRDHGAERVAVIDIDAHHGNGTQAIFYDRPDVYYGSVHVDPGAGWFPHYAGFADERGRGDGDGANRNIPVPPGTGDGRWLDAVRRLCEDARGADAIVVSLGLDAAATDPESPLEVSPAGYREACRLIAGLAPAVLIQEGGYDLPSLGELAVAALTGAGES